MIFAGSDYLAELSKWMDIDVLPPCINPNGHGETAIGMPKNMECGDIPAYVGPQGAGYNPPGTGISEPSSPSCLKHSETASLTDEDSDGEENPADLSVSLGALRVA